MRVLITGAAGFIGFHMTRCLSSAADYEIFAVDNFERGVPDEHYSRVCSRPNVHEVVGDLSDAAFVRDLPDVDYVYHLAALNGTQNFYDRPLDVLRSSTLPTLFLADRYANTGLERFVYAGTSESYASTVTRFGWPVPTGEDVPLGIEDVFNPRWSYAASKIHGEVVTAQAGRAHDMRFSIVRYHNVYGPRMGDKHVIPDFFARAKSGVYSLYGHEETRSFLYIDDAVAATILIAETEACSGEIVNVGSQEELRILDLAQSMMQSRSLKGEIQLFDPPAGSVRRRAPDTSKLCALTGFTEEVDLGTGLEATAKFYLDGILVDPLRHARAPTT